MIKFIFFYFSQEKGKLKKECGQGRREDRRVMWEGGKYMVCTGEGAVGKKVVEGLVINLMVSSGL